MDKISTSLVTLDYPDKMEILCQLVRGPRTELHWHIDHELLLSISGKSAVTVDNETMYLSEGDMAFINQGSMHQIEAETADAIMLFINFDSSFTDLAFIDEPTINRVRFDLSLGGGFSEDERPLLLNWMTLIAKRYFEHDMGYRMDCPGMLLQLLAHISRRGMWTAVDEPQFSGSEPENAYYLLSYLHRKENYSRPLTLELAAKEVHMSQSSISRILRSTVAMSFRGYLSFVRICQAKRALNLMNTTDTISNLALECGFSSLPSFYRVFKQYSGMNPSEYIQLQKQKKPDLSAELATIAGKDGIEVIELFRKRNRYR